MESTTPSNTWKLRLTAVLLIVGSAALRLWYLANNCPLDLAPDEAHYWQWAQHLDWSYYSKGPLVAWLIHLSCWLLGGWSVQLTGSEMLAVRLPAVLCGSLLLASLYVLTTQVNRNEKLALVVVACALTMPLLAVGSVLMTIDAPFVCLWGWGLVFGFAAIFRKCTWAWPALGVVVGLGILAKYTMILWLASLGLFLLTSKKYRQLLWHPGLWCCLGLSLLFCVPIVWWNLQHNWVGIWHVQQLANGQSEVARFYWYGPLAYVGIQFGLLLGAWFYVWVRGMWAARPWQETDEQKNYLWWMSFVTFAVFFVFGFTTNGGEANWPAVAYLSGLVLAAGWLHQEWSRSRGGYRKAIEVTLAGTCALGLGFILLLFRHESVTPALHSLASFSPSNQPLAVRHIDPSCRLRGWQTLARRVDAELAKLRKQGIEPVLAAGSWVLPGELSFYCQRKPQVFSIGLALGARHSQHDLWRPNPVFDPELYLGRTFVFVGDPEPLFQTDAFESYGATQVITHCEEGIPVATWKITVCKGFRGFEFQPGKNRLY